MIINICYCKSITFKGAHLCKKKKKITKSFIPTGKLYLIEQNWFVDLMKKTFYFDLNLHTLVLPPLILAPYTFFLPYGNLKMCWKAWQIGLIIRKTLRMIWTNKQENLRFLITHIELLQINSGHTYSFIFIT